MARERLTTGVGSLPFRDPAVALTHVFKAYDVPFYPQLPQCSRPPAAMTLAPMLAEILTPPMLRAVGARDELVELLMTAAATPEVARDHVRALPAIEEFLRRGKGAGCLKSQLIGPNTATRLLAAVVGPSAELAAAVWPWVTSLTRAWADVLAESTGASILIWDEGALATEWTCDEQATWTKLMRELASRGAQLGLHSCTPGKLADLVAVATCQSGKTASLPTWLSVDLNVIDATSTRSQSTGATSRLIAGVVDTRGATLDFDRSVATLGVALEVPTGPGPLLLSGGCGTGLHTEAFERELATHLKRLTKVSP